MAENKPQTQHWHISDTSFISNQSSFNITSNYKANVYRLFCVICVRRMLINQIITLLTLREVFDSLASKCCTCSSAHRYLSVCWQSDTFVDTILFLGRPRVAACFGSWDLRLEQNSKTEGRRHASLSHRGLAESRDNSLWFPPGIYFPQSSDP